jgi:tRNA 5-methylaminomethyl-2-thiouridine biosynthesis bifunctional protein
VAIAPWLAAGRVAGRLDGLLRLEQALDEPAMQRLLQHRGLPGEMTLALGRDAATERAGCSVGAPAWWFAQGGWVEARALVRSWLQHSATELRLSTRIDRLLWLGDGRWRLFDCNGRDLGDFGQVVLANASDAQRLAASTDESSAALQWPLSRSRGQVTLIDASAAADWRPRVPIAGAGYAIALPDGALLCGATDDASDDEAAVRTADHERNLASLRTLSGRPWPIDVSSLDGRVGWRVHARDRLPLLGAVPLPSDSSARAQRRDQPRFIARQPGLFVFAALGSRGLTHAALGGEIVASMLTGAPLPIGSPLLDAIDVGRFEARAQRTK